jgi:hypothetical protein
VKKKIKFRLRKKKRKRGVGMFVEELGFLQAGGL